MIVGVSTIEIFIPDSRSLKGKRKVLNGIKSRIRNKYNVSINEVDFSDLWQRAKLGVSIVGNSSKFVDSTLSKVLNEIKKDLRIEVIDYKMELKI